MQIWNFVFKKKRLVFLISQAPRVQSFVLFDFQAPGSLYKLFAAAGSAFICYFVICPHFAVLKTLPTREECQVAGFAELVN